MSDDSTATTPSTPWASPARISASLRRSASTQPHHAILNVDADATGIHPHDAADHSFDDIVLNVAVWTQVALQHIGPADGAHQSPLLEHGQPLHAVLTQKRRVKIGGIGIIDRQRRLLLGHASRKARADRNSDAQIDFHSFRRPRNQAVVFLEQENHDRINVHRFAHAIEQLREQLVQRQIRQRDLSYRLHLSHATHRSLELQSRSLFTGEELRSLFLCLFPLVQAITAPDNDVDVAATAA